MKHYLFVGATSGLGAVTAKLAEAEGHAVSVLALPPKRGENHFVCDVTDEGTVIAALKAVRRPIDGVACFQRLRGDRSTWDGEFDTQLTGTRYVIDHALPGFAPRASIVLTASMTAASVTDRMSPGYHVAKAGMVQLARFYAFAFGPRGVRVNAVLPGTFVKPENERHFKENPEEAERLARACPLGRMLRAEEVGRAILFLLSDAASGITGASLVVDGGVSLRWQEDLVT